MIEVCLGFDGSQTDDWTALRAETIGGHLFTPTYGPESLPTIWNPVDYGGWIPRAEVHAAVSQVFREFKVIRMYADPPYWQSEVEAWALEHGEKVVIPWPTYRMAPMHAALERFKTDLSEKTLTHDACPITAAHIANARMIPAKGSAGRYYLGKPAQAQKIDAAVTSVLCHEAACDARADGWGTQTESYAYVF